MSDFLSFVRSLISFENTVIDISKEVSKTSFGDYRNAITLKKNVVSSYEERFDDLISEFNNNFSSSFLETNPNSTKKSFSFIPIKPIQLKKIKFYVDDFYFYDSPTNFKVTLEYASGGSLSFNIIPDNHLGTYLEVFSLTEKVHLSKFACKREFPVKIYNDEFNLIDIKYSFRDDGYLELPNSSYDKVYVSYTPTFENYEYSVNSLIKSLVVETDIALNKKVYFSNI